MLCYRPCQGGLLLCTDEANSSSPCTSEATLYSTKLDYLWLCICFATLVFFVFVFFLEQVEC